jgi:predicted ester cyclase
MAQVTFDDFYQVPNLKFDISRLRSDLELVLKRRQFNSPGVTHFGAIIKYLTMKTLLKDID